MCEEKSVCKLRKRAIQFFFLPFLYISYKCNDLCSVFQPRFVLRLLSFFRESWRLREKYKKKKSHLFNKLFNVLPTDHNMPYGRRWYRHRQVDFKSYFERFESTFLSSYLQCMAVGRLFHFQIYGNTNGIKCCCL